MSTTILVPLDQVNFRVEDGFLSLSILYGEEDVATEILEKAENNPQLGDETVQFIDGDKDGNFWVIVHGTHVKLPLKQFEIVQFLWCNGPTPLDVFCRKFWKNGLASRHAIYSMRRYIQNSFLEQGIDCSISIAGGTVELLTVL